MPPFSYSLSGKINTGFLKLVVSTRPLNYSSAAGLCLCDPGAQYTGRVLKQTWGTVTIPMIQSLQSPSPSQKPYKNLPSRRKKPVNPVYFLSLQPIITDPF